MVPKLKLSTSVNYCAEISIDGSGAYAKALAAAHGLDNYDLGLALTEKLLALPHVTEVIEYYDFTLKLDLSTRNAEAARCRVQFVKTRALEVFTRYKPEKDK